MRKRIIVSLPEKLLDVIDAKAKREERTRSEIIRAALEKIAS
jgi:metal-responsive CopG/Arc/MetJ family transcriptional regulator